MSTITHLGAPAPGTAPAPLDRPQHVAEPCAVGLRVGVVGAGYVGLVTAAGLAHLGARVTCVDIDTERVDRLERGEIPIVEAGLDELVASSRERRCLRFAVGAAAAADGADVVFLCVPTPEGEGGAPDTSYVEQAAREIAAVLPPGAVVAVKSTVPVGTGELVERAIGRDDVFVVSNPEFLREGVAVGDFLRPDRVVIGVAEQRAAERMLRLYAGLEAPMIVTDRASAETIKYVANGFLATKISFANEVAALCDAVGADVDDVLRGMASDRRIGGAFLRPGPGWGGSCFPKDSIALVTIAAMQGVDLQLMRAAIAANERQLERTCRTIARAAGRDLDLDDDLTGVAVAVLGLTFKAGTSDLRRSPSLAVIGQLHALGATVRAFDPTAARELDAEQTHQLDGIDLAADAYDAAIDADVVAVLTEWPEFCELDIEKLAGTMRGSALVDTRNVLEPGSVRAGGLAYLGMGRR